MIVVVAIDALEYELVEKFNCTNLRQKHYGKTNISEFTEPRTMVLWTSFLTGRNTEEEILAKGKEGMWDTQIAAEDSFVKIFTNPRVIDLPGYSYDKEQHKLERKLLKEFFDAGSGRSREEIKEEYHNSAFEHHRRVRKEFEESLGAGHDFLVGYFSLADVIGHLSFGNITLMRMIYRDFDEMVASVKKNRECKLLVLSDHGMKAIGPYGDHSEYGFWSTDAGDLGTPRLVDFGDILIGWLSGD